MGEVGCGVMLIVVFWEVGGGYGGVAAEEVGGDYGEKESVAEMRERELLRGEREFLSVFSFIFNKVFISLFF
jgi:hypothetical protein